MEFQRFEPLASADWCALLRQRERKPLGLFVNIGFVGSVFESLKSDQIVPRWKFSLVLYDNWHGQTGALLRKPLGSKSCVKN